MSTRMHDEEIEVDERLVRLLLAAQFPGVADRPLTKIEPWGTDNAIWRLGDDRVVRLPRIYWATEQVEREATWLPRLAPRLPVSVPEPIAIGTHEEAALAALADLLAPYADQPDEARPRTERENRFA